MRTSALILVGLVVAIAGCPKPAAKVQADYSAPQAPPEPELFAVDPAGSAVMPEPGSSTSTYSPSSGSSSGETSGAGGGSNTAVASSEWGGSSGMAGSGGATMHKVARGDTLYSLARKYYNDPKRWKTILDANRDKIPSPKALPVGQTLVIP